MEWWEQGLSLRRHSPSWQGKYGDRNGRHMVTREKAERGECRAQLAISFIYTTRIPVQRMVLPKFRASVSTSINLIFKPPHSHTLRLNSWVILAYAKLTE